MGEIQLETDIALVLHYCLLKPIKKERMIAAILDNLLSAYIGLELDYYRLI